MTREEAIEALNNLDSGDNEIAHSMADDILCEYLISIGETGVAEAYRKADERITFWYA